MQIEITRTARRFHLPPDIAQAFIEAGLATEVPKEHLAPATVEPRWVIRLNPYSGTPSLVHVSILGESIYPGPNCIIPTVEGAQAAFSSTGHRVPDDVIERFSALLERGQGITPDAANEARFQAQNAQYAREDRERAAARKLGH